MKEYESVTQKVLFGNDVLAAKKEKWRHTSKWRLLMRKQCGLMKIWYYYCHVVGVTIDGVLDSILYLLTTNILTTGNYKQLQRHR
jgi:hypothetical protein